MFEQNGNDRRVKRKQQTGAADRNRWSKWRSTAASAGTGRRGLRRHPTGTGLVDGPLRAVVTGIAAARWALASGARLRHHQLVVRVLSSLHHRALKVMAHREEEEVTIGHRSSTSNRRYSTKHSPPQRILRLARSESGASQRHLRRCWSACPTATTAAVTAAVTCRHPQRYGDEAR